jgi:hypothetical protein
MPTRRRRAIASIFGSSTSANPYECVPTRDTGESVCQAVEAAEKASLATAARLNQCRNATRMNWQRHVSEDKVSPRSADSAAQSESKGEAQENEGFTDPLEFRRAKNPIDIVGIVSNLWFW